MESNFDSNTVKYRSTTPDVYFKLGQLVPVVETDVSDSYSDVFQLWVIMNLVFT